MFRSDGTSRLHVEEGSASTSNGRIMALFENNGAAQISLVDTNSTADWRVQNFAEAFRITRAGTGVTELALDGAGVLQLENNGTAQLALVNMNNGSDWRFQNFSDTFRVSRAGTGVAEMTLTATGNMTIQGVLTQNSDKNAKMAIEPVDPDEILATLTALPVAAWTYKDDTSGARHVGPMAQDFHALFGLGETATGISTMDTSGVALAAIQALAEKNAKLSEQNAAQDAVIASQNAIIVDLAARLQQLESAITPTATK